MTPVRDAATVIVTRQGPEGLQVLMGQRGASAAFMPNKLVFPGGAVDFGDASVPFAAPLPAPTRAQLIERSAALPEALAGAAIRELWEEAGLIAGRPGLWPGAAPPDWADFAATGHLPDASGLRLLFRAVTPPGRPRRFDARFFTLPAEALAGEVDDLSRAGTELSHLGWRGLAAARAADLPFITRIVLSELDGGGTHEGVPFFISDETGSRALRLGAAG